ncbi:MAG: hypothetical protein GY922_06575, partial [Proteobacteria bacterium]|nr:hypothetical protein [Pseudomonadota bacterium]
MEATMLDMLWGALLLVFGIFTRYFLSVLSTLRAEDMKLHTRITDIATNSASRQEVQGAIDRVISRIDKLEERLMNK